MTTTKGTLVTTSRLVKLALGMLLAVGTATALPSCSTDTSVEPLGKSTEGALTCMGAVCPADSGTCGSWTCDANKFCLFRQEANEGDACSSIAGTPSDGHCTTADDSKGVSYLKCCVGCAQDVNGRFVCLVGDQPGYCGAGGDRCVSCSACETCKAGKCVAAGGGVCGTCKSCASGACMAEPVGTGCANGRCSADAVCCSSCLDTTGQCLANTDQHCGSAGSQCQACGQCGTCMGGACQPKSGGCDDGDPCTENDKCNNGACAGTPVPVDDGNPCTDDACTSSTGVTHVSKPEGTMCDDGSACTTGERCTDHDGMPATARRCVPTGGVDCTDSNPCTSDVPDTSCMTCPHTPLMNGTPCVDETSRCVVNESCQDGACTGEPRDCDDGNPCTQDTCEDADGTGVDPITGCKHEPEATSTTCDDSNDCTEDDHCADTGECTGTAKTCTAFDDCHDVGSCDPGTGECTDPRLPEGSACESTGTCDANGRCQGGTPMGTGGGSGTGSGGTGTGEAGDNGTGGGSGGSSGTGTGEAGDNGTGGGSGAAAGTDGTLYVRDPRGCSCEMPGRGSAPGGALVLSLGGLLALVTRRRRAA